MNEKTKIELVGDEEKYVNLDGIGGMSIDSICDTVAFQASANEYQPEPGCYVLVVHRDSLRHIARWMERAATIFEEESGEDTSRH